MRVIELFVVACCIFATMIASVAISFLLFTGFDVSYHASYFNYRAFLIFFTAWSIILGTVSLLFIVPWIILKIKKIPAKNYMFSIAAVILMSAGIAFVASLWQSADDLSYTVSQIRTATGVYVDTDEMPHAMPIAGLISAGMGIAFITPVIIALKKRD